jgi:transposase
MLVGHRQLAVVVAAVVRQLNRNSVEHAPRGQLRRWVEQHGAGREPSADHAAEIARLQRENERLRMERDILKKSIVIFAGAPK